MPSLGFGHPGPSSLVQVSPPSVVFHSAQPGPPPLYPHQVRRRWNDAAYRILGLPGSMATSVNPVSGSMYLDFFQVWPPSVDLYRPRSALGPKRCPPAATYTVLGSVESTTMRPIDCVSSRPRCVQWSPPSVVPQTPSPMDELWRLLASPVPTYTTLGSEGAMAMAPIDSFGMLSNCDFQ